jgi:hypothetical protein
MKPLLDFLEEFAKRPQMWVGTVTFIPVLNYLRGLRDGCEFAGIEYSWEHYLAAAESRGWDPRGNIGIERDFIRKGLSDEEMARELIAVEIEAYRRAMEDSNDRSKRKSKR